MIAPGLIFAPTISLGDKLKRDLGLKYWWVSSPRNLRLGGLRGISSEPRLLLVKFGDWVDTEQVYEKYAEEFLPTFRFHRPVIYTISKFT